MGKTRLLAVIVAFLIVAILAVLLLPGEEARPAEKEEEEPMVFVAAARMEIPAYTFITEEMVYLKEVPESSVHANDMRSVEDVIGRRSLVTMVSDEVIMLNHIIDPDDPANRLAYKIDPGMRAMTVAVDDTSGVCDQIRAGDHVDVIVEVQDVEREAENDSDEYEYDEYEYGEPGGQRPGEAKNAGRILSLMTLQNIEVLSLDQDTLYAPRQEPGVWYYRQVTLSVTPEDAVKLGWAQYEGRIYLALRAENDEELAETEPYGAVKALAAEGEE